MSNGFLHQAGLWNREVQAEGENPEALQAKFDSSVGKTEQKLLTLLEAVIENFRSIKQWEFLIYRCYYR